MSTINIFRSLADDTYETIHPEGNISIKEAVQADLANAVISVNGFGQDENYILEDGDLCTVRLFPGGSGGGSFWDWFVGNLGGSLYGAMIGGIFGPWGALIGAGIGGTVGLLAGGIASAKGLSITGIIRDLINPQQPDLKSPEALAKIPQLRGAKNQSNYNKPIPIVMGKHLYTPMYIGAPHTEIGGEDGEDQYFNALFLLGYGKLQVTDIKLGILGDLCSNKGANAKDDGLLVFDGNPAYKEDDPDNNPRLELRQGASGERDDGEVGLYPQKVFEEQLGIELTNIPADGEDNKVLQVPGFTAKNPMKVQAEFTFGAGLIEYNNKGEKQDASVSISIRWRRYDGDEWKPFGQIGIKPDGGYEAGITYSGSTSTITRRKPKMMRFIAERDFSYSEAVGATDRTIELLIERTSKQDLENTRISDKVYLTAIRTWCFDYEKSSANNLVPQAPMIEKYRNKTCRLGFRIKASGSVQGTLDALNCIVQSYGRTWDGENWTDPGDEEPTQNPASIALKLLQSPSLGSKAYPDEMLDMASFGVFYNWCNEKNFACNGVLTSKKKVDDVLAAVLGTGRAMRMINGNKYGVMIDRPRPAPVTILNSQNVLEATNQKAFVDRPAGLCVSFINEKDGYSQNEAYAMYNGSRQPQNGDLIENIDMPFVTDYGQAYKNAMYQLACLYLRPEAWKRKVSVNGYLIALGDRVDIQDDTILVGIGEGAEITGLVYDSGGNITGINTDGLFDVTDTAQRYGVKITQYDGVNPPSIRTKEVATPGAGVYRDFVFAARIETTDTVKPSIGDIVSFGIYDRITTPALCFGKKDNGDGTFDITLVPYQEGVYTADSGTIPEFDSKLTPPQKLAGIPELPADTVTREEAIAIAQNFGTPGPPATVYKLIPGATVIKRYNSGVIDPPKISCEQQAITGDSPPVPSNKTLKYVTERAGAETLYTGPVTVGAWEFIEFRLYDDDGDTLLDRENVPVLTDGPPATVYHVIPSVPMVIRDPSGAASPPEISCAQQVVFGSSPPEPANKTLVYTTSASPGETPYEGPVPVAWDWIEFLLYDENGKLLDRERVFALSEGEPARAYELQPSASVIKVYDGITEPYKISCAQVSITGSGLPVPAGKTLRYATSLDGEKDYGGEITVNPAWAWIEFLLYDGDTLLDRERVPVLADGASPVYLDLTNQNITVRADEYGEPYGLPLTTQAVLYNGNIPVTDAAFKASLEEKNIVYYPGDTFDPMLEGFYPVEMTRWFLSKNYVTSYEIARYPGDSGDIFDPMLGGFYPVQKEAGFIQPLQVSIDRDGLITINQLAGDEAAIIVSAKYRDAVYSAPLALIKVKDAERPVIIDIENENASVACDAYGAPYPGELPLVTKAIFYKGTEPVAPFWFLDTPARGISIAQDGTITVAENAGLGRSNNIPVMAAYRGKTYTRMLTITKALEGFAATVYELLPGARVVRRDAAGNSSPAALGCSQQKTSGNDAPESAGKTLVYVTSASPEETPYTGPVTVGSLSWIEFRLRDGGTVLDRERVPVVSDGEGSITIDLENENTTVRCDAYGVPYPDSLPLTTKAVLYDGWDEASPAWSLESPPAGVSIAGNGTITVAKGAALGNINNIRVKAQYKGASYTHVFTIGKTLDGESPVTLDILPDTEVIQCDYLGNPLRGLPLEAKATLYKGTLEVTAAMELAEAAKVDILYYPGNIFDPMLGGFYPTLGYPVAWSLSGAPSGVAVGRYGLITVSGTAQLGDTNEITVRAAYHGKTYEAVFGITKARGGTPGRGILSVVSWYYQSDSSTALTGGSWAAAVPARTSGKYIWQKTVTTYTDGTSSETKPVCITGEQGDPAPHYRGVTLTADTGNTGIVTLKLGGKVLANTGDWVSYLGATIDNWENGCCMRWNGAKWEAVPIEANGNFETNPYVAALMDLTEGAPHGRFMSILVRDLIAKTAMIEEIQAQLMQITGAIFGGERFTKSGNAVIDNGADKRGFKLGADGKLIASNGEFSGLLNVKSIRIDGNVAAGDNYLLKAANYMVKVAPIDTGWIDTSVPQIAKQLLTMARGTANVRLVFPATKGFTSGTINAGDYKIYVNGAVAAAGSVLNDSMTDNVEKTHAVNLNGDSNQVWLELFPGGGGNYTGKFPIYNTVFELRIAQDPGLLAAL